MSANEMWIVVANCEDFRGGHAEFTVHDLERDARNAAIAQADSTRKPHDVYFVERIGSASVPQAVFHDNRPLVLGS